MLKSKKTAAFIIILASIFCTTSCKKNEEILSKNYFALDTIITISIYSYSNDADAEAIMDKCFDLCKHYEQIFSKTVKDSDIHKLNHKEKFEHNEFTDKIINDSLDISEATEGAFDITISPLVDLWNISGGNTSVPSKDKINDCLKKVNYKNIISDSDSFSLKKNTQVDLGGIAKGFIADKLKNYMVSEGVTSAIINLGGNVLTIGDNNGDDFTIGIKKPFSKKENEYSAKIKIKDKSVVTSGSYERYFKKDGKIYHHILNPKTGYPVENNLNSVTIISENSEYGDAYSTACFVLGLDKGMKFIEQQNDTEAIFITKDNKFHLTSGLKFDNGKNVIVKKINKNN